MVVNPVGFPGHSQPSRLLTGGEGDIQSILDQTERPSR